MYAHFAAVGDNYVNKIAGLAEKVAYPLFDNFIIVGDPNTFYIWLTGKD